MIIFTHRYPVPGHGVSSADADELWRSLLHVVVLEPDPRHDDIEPNSLPLQTDFERDIEARGQQVHEHVHVDHGRRRLVLTRTSGRERGCLGYEISGSIASLVVIVTACLAVEGIASGSAAELHMRDWFGAEQYAVVHRAIVGAVSLLHDVGHR